MGKYLKRRVLLDQIGNLPGNQLDTLVLAGAVRTVKFGTNRQSPRLYCLEDAQEALERMAEGRQPVRRRRA